MTTEVHISYLIKREDTSSAWFCRPSSLQAITSVSSHVRSWKSRLFLWTVMDILQFCKSIHAFHVLIETDYSSWARCWTFFTAQAKIRASADNLHCGLYKPKFSYETPSNCHSRLLWVTVLFIPFCSCSTGLFASRVPARPQRGWGGLLDEWQTLVGRVAGAAETMCHLIRGGEVYLPATDTLLLGVTCRTDSS